MNKYCTDVSNYSSRDVMEAAMLSRLSHFPIGHPLHFDFDSRYCTLDREQVKAFILGNNLQIIRITLDRKNAIIIFAGTKVEQIQDIAQDSLIALDSVPGLSILAAPDNLVLAWYGVGQINAARAYVRQQAGFGYNLYLTGYSLGGHIAVDSTLNCSRVTECVSIDPPGRGDILISQGNPNASVIVNYCNRYSTISWIGGLLGVGHVGEVHWLDVEDNWMGPIHNHGIEQTIDALGGFELYDG